MWIGSDERTSAEGGAGRNSNEEQRALVSTNCTPSEQFSSDHAYRASDVCEGEGLPLLKIQGVCTNAYVDMQTIIVSS